MTRRRSRARILTLAMLAVAICVGLVFFPLRRGSAQPNGKDPPAAPAKPKKGAKPAPLDGGVADAGEAGAPAAAAEADGHKDVHKEAAKGEKSDKAETPSIPIGRGLPVNVSVGVMFLEVRTFDDIKGEFEATVDLRLRWQDMRLASPKTVRGYQEFRGKDAEEQLTKMWAPTIEVTNRLETSGYVGRRVRLFPDGKVELITRTTAKHTTRIDAESFPFDRQHPSVDLIVREDTTDEVVLTFDTEDVTFSRAARDAQLDGWKLGLVQLKSDSVAGWNGDRYSKASAVLSIERQASTSLAPIFIPLFASLLIPLLALWMNKADEEGSFEVDAFELANMGIGGLFSVIALSFAVYSSYGVIANGDNTVTRLFGLNYAMLAITLAIVVVLFRYNVVAKLFGRHVQAELFHFLSWSLPLLSLAVSAAFLLVAAA